MANDSPVPAAGYVGWEEAVVTNEKGRREIHYYLKRRCSGGGRDLVVVGKEKSARHTSYRYTVDGKKLLLSFYNRSSWLKLRSRREVIDWLNSFVSDEPSVDVPKTKLHADFVKSIDTQISVRMNDFKWLGSPWTCRKRRNHYQSFCRNGAVISANDFVYVLAEEGKRLVAYLDDMYEDIRGNKMVVVRWFHKLDEVGFILPHYYNDREIFFSLCLQDLSIECIDGLATVLSPEHYEKFFNQASTCTGLTPFVCSRLFENDDFKPYDITRVKGYWNQEILKKKFPRVEHPEGVRPSKRIRWSIDTNSNSKSPIRNDNLETGILKEVSDPPTILKSLPKKDDPTILNSQQFLTVGSDIEILSQDSGIRGCWFRASVIKKHKDKVKVKYLDLKDALDDSKCLEEWILATRIVSPDALGIRLSGRMVSRPMPRKDVGQVNVGCVVDAWWNDGWWEGIVASAESDDKIKVYFPGEKQELVFSQSDLRHSKEWLDNQWHSFDEKPDVVSSIYGTNNLSNPVEGASEIITKSLDTPDGNDDNNNKPRKLIKIVHKKRQTSTEAIRDLLKDCLLTHLQWKSSGKRRRRSSRSPIHKIQFSNNETRLQSLGKFLMSSFDQDNCKYAISDTHFTSAVVPPLTNLVMSR